MRLSSELLKDWAESSSHDKVCTVGGICTDLMNVPDDTMVVLQGAQLGDIG